MKKLIFWFVVIYGVYFASRMMLAWHTPHSDSETRVNIEITRGQTLQGISESLQESDLISDPFAFRLYSKWKGVSAKYQAGHYMFQKNLTYADLADLLQHGKSPETKITIPEGSTIAQIDDILAKKSLIEPGSFESCASYCDLGFRISNLEGSLFPSTYYVSPNSFTNKKFIQRLYKTFQQQLDPLREDIISSGRTLDEIVKMASMIEREANHDAEMPMIADVLWKRLDEKIHLGVDATTRYELNNWKRPLYTEDFQKDSPYNTRKRRGLPPTAISNPGIKALKAAVYPEKNPYYYYLHDPKGQVHWGKTHDDHVRNKQQYLY